MPCNCIVDKPTYPQNDEWGPYLWFIFHTLAQKAGKQTNGITMGDEQRAWPLFMKSVVLIIPCPYCKDHFQDYLKKNPFDLPMDYYAWNEYIVDWFYNFHEAVNARLGKPSFPKEGLKRYGDSSIFKTNMEKLEKIINRAIQMGGVSLFYWRAWLKQYNMLKSAIV